MTSILFSIPAHERPEIVAGTIANARKMNGLGHHFVVHASASWTDFDPNDIDMPGVHYNPIRWSTGHAHSQIPTHITNFLYGLELGLDFQYFAVLHTSEMFVRGGMPQHISGTDHSLWFTPDTQPREMNWPPLAHAFGIGMFKDLFDPRDPHNYLGNLIEGSWWSRELFQEIVNWTTAHYSIDKMLFPWAAEECYFPTLSWHLTNGKNFKHPYCAFHPDVHFLEDTQMVDDIRAGLPVNIWQPHNFVYNWAPSSSDSLFSAKRISREPDDPVRVYISWLKP
jgi:hypothetical protein